MRKRTFKTFYNPSIFKFEVRIKHTGNSHKKENYNILLQEGLHYEIESSFPEVPKIKLWRKLYKGEELFILRSVDIRRDLLYKDEPKI